MFSELPIDCAENPVSWEFDVVHSSASLYLLPSVIILKYKRCNCSRLIHLFCRWFSDALR